MKNQEQDIKKECCAFCLEGGEMEVTKCKTCPCHPAPQDKTKGVEITVCPMHGNKEWKVEPTHYCNSKIRGGCNCKCVCPAPQEEKKPFKQACGKCNKCTHCMYSDCPCHKPFSKEEYHMRERPDAAPQEEKCECKCGLIYHPHVFKKTSTEAEKSSEVFNHILDNRLSPHIAKEEEKCELAGCKGWPSYHSHTSLPAKEEEDWEKAFDKIYDENRFTSKEYPSGKYRTKFEITNAVHPEKIKSFIRALLVKEKEAERDKIRQMLEKMKISQPIKYSTVSHFVSGVNSAIDSILQVLTQKHD